jgi:hypothetical protein
MKVTVTNRSYVKAAKELLKPGEELPIDFNRLKSAYNIVDVDYTLRDWGFDMEFKSEADAILYLLRFA